MLIKTSSTRLIPPCLTHDVKSITFKLSEV